MPKYTEGTPEFYAEFFLNSVKILITPALGFQTRFNKINDKSIEFKLKAISEELKRLDKDMKTAGYAVGTFYNTQNLTLTSEAKNLVSRAKDLYLEYLKSKEAENRAKVNDFLASIPENKRSNTSRQYADLCTDSAFSHLELIGKLPSLALEIFYEHQLESYKSLCEQQRDYIMLFNLSNILDELTDQEQKDLTLRKIVTTNPHRIVLEQLLERGANPLAKGAQSGLNAIDRANAENLPLIATWLNSHVEKNKDKLDVNHSSNINETNTLSTNLNYRPN